MPQHAAAQQIFLGDRWCLAVGSQLTARAHQLFLPSSVPAPLLRTEPLSKQHNVVFNTAFGTTELVVPLSGVHEDQFSVIWGWGWNIGDAANCSLSYCPSLQPHHRPQRSLLPFRPPSPPPASPTAPPTDSPKTQQGQKIGADAGPVWSEIVFGGIKPKASGNVSRKKQKTPAIVAQSKTKWGRRRQT